jgi:hypothetical protein
MATEHSKRPSATKRGPGRDHAAVKKAKRPPTVGAGAEFIVHKNPLKNLRRSIKANVGARQLRKTLKREARAIRAGA